MVHVLLSVRVWLCLSQRAFTGVEVTAPRDCISLATLSHAALENMSLSYYEHWPKALNSAFI
jgi:hypothetical protein